MNWLRRSFFSLVLLTSLVFVNLIPPQAPRVAAGEPTRFVRVARSELSKFTQLGISARVALDYGAYAWFELGEAEYARLAASSIQFWEETGAGQVAVPGYRFDPLAQGEPVLPSSLQADPARPGFRLVQFAGPIKDEWMGLARSTGLQLLQYYPYHAYLAWGTATQAEAASRQPFVRWTGLFHPAYKINADLSGRSGRIDNVDVMFYNDGDVAETLRQLRSLGGEILQLFPSQPDQAFFDAIIRLQAEQVQAVARIPTVLWLGYASPQPVLDDEMSDQIVAGNTAGGVPFTGYSTWLDGLGVDGTGVTWAIVDTGVDYDHPDLGGHIVGGYNFPGTCNFPGQPGSDCADGGHGTHVAGIVGGNASGGYTDANGFLYGLGVAPAYRIFAMNSLLGSNWPPLEGWQAHSRVAILGGAIGGNNSWTTGEPTPHGYQASERTHDLMVRDGNFNTPAVAEPFIEVFSAGNSGPTSTTITPPKEAKNLIVVASSLNYRTGSIDTISSFSSRGPSVDGRYVPTIAAPGQVIASSRNDLGGDCADPIPGTDNLYAYCYGTSMAAPHASGAVVLLAEWWRTFSAGADPSPAMAKALLVNGAVDMGTADIPNFSEGWGRIDLSNVIQTDVSTVYVDQSAVLQNAGGTMTFTVAVVDPSKPLKVTLAWSDAPGAVGANPALVNNLDLTVVNGSSTYLGNRFSGGWSVTGGSPDSLNNLENVYLVNPSGFITITVQATNLPGDGIPYNGDLTDQDFALVCSNCAEFPDFTLLAVPLKQSICAPTQGTYTVTVSSLLGYSDPVALSASISPPSPLTTAFSLSNAVPPFTSDLIVGNTLAASPGAYSITLLGTAPTSTHTTTLRLNLFNAFPLAPVLLSPANGSSNLPLRPLFTWSPASQATSYDIQIAADSAFTNVVASASGLTATSFTPLMDLQSGRNYNWRVRAHNVCGDGGFSDTFSFTTETLPGDCPIGMLPVYSLSEDFESGASGWSHSGSGDTWVLVSDRAHSGVYAYRAVDPSTVSDQQLVSPIISLPADLASLTLQFWNYQAIEDHSLGCYDGAILEISQDGGESWAQMTNPNLLTDPYNGLVSTSSGNPLGGLSAWCGDPQNWLNSVIDLNAYAGQDVRFRFRLGSDSLYGREGWYIDDVVVQGCQPIAGVLVSPLHASQSGLPGEVLTYTVHITNTGYFTDTFMLALDGNLWQTTAPSSSGEVGPGAAEEILVLVTLPIAPPPEPVDLLITDSFTLTVASSWDSSVVVQATGTSSSTVTPGVELGGDPTGAGLVGGQAIASIAVTNAGNFADAFNLSASGVWPATLSLTNTGQLLPGQSVTLTLTVDIPLGVADGAAQVITLAAVSGLDTSATATREISITALHRRLYLPVLRR